MNKLLYYYITILIIHSYTINILMKYISIDQASNRERSAN
jgi:hypothetical protein